MARCASCGQENPDGFRFCGACGGELAPPSPAREVRKTVTVLFCDVSGSTAMGERLDPESTRRVMSRYFDEMRAAIERHGGTVEKFIGDAVMAVFGIPVVHEDDALRAVRAAADMREALGRLNDELERDWGVRIESRIGLNTGEVVTGEGDSIATGDAVNVAARLEQLAAPGKTLIGESTHRLVRDAVTAQPLEPLAAKGKSEPISAFRLKNLIEGGEFISRRLDSPLVGRENELAQIQRAFDHAVAERVAYQFTLLGPAGIGKSRLVRELHDRVDARLLAGRCLPYGEGITYWPLGEIEPFSSEIDFEANRDEIALQTRRILERLARERPLLVVFDDLQWAEPTFLDLIDHVTDLARDAPMLLVCVARPELLDVRPGWGGGKLNATTMLLEALTEAESAQLVDNLILARLDSRMKERISAAGEGNPLYLEEMLAMVAEGSNGELAIPPTIQALLAARLDRLAPDERTAVEWAAIQGQEFRHDALAELVPATLSGRLAEIDQSSFVKTSSAPRANTRSGSSICCFATRRTTRCPRSSGPISTSASRGGSRLPRRSSKRSAASTSSRPTATARSSGRSTRRAVIWLVEPRRCWRMRGSARGPGPMFTPRSTCSSAPSGCFPRETVTRLRSIRTSRRRSQMEVTSSGPRSSVERRKSWTTRRLRYAPACAGSGSSSCAERRWRTPSLRWKR